MAKAEFTKGQKVYVYHGDSRTAAVTFVPYTVASCGAKQLHLIRDDGSNAEFRVYAPFRGTRRFSDVQPAAVDPVEHAKALRKQFAGWLAEHYEDRTRHAQELLESGALGAEGYAKSINEAKAAFEQATADIR